MKKLLYAFSFFSYFLLNTGDSVAQLTTTIGTGTGGSSYLYAPVYTFGGANLVRTVRIAYIYPSSLLTGLSSGQNITALEWFRNNNTGSLGTGVTWKIYIKNISANDWGANSLLWTDAINGATLVFDGDPQSFVGGAVNGWRMVNLSTPYSFNQSNGNNLAIMCEYIQPGTGSSATTINWNYDNTAQVSAYAANQVKYSTSTTTTPATSLASSTSIHPQIRITYAPPAGLDVGLQGFPSIPNGIAPGVIPVTAQARNYGGTTLTSFTINWQLDGVTQSPFLFSGNLASTRDSILTLGSPTIADGVHTLKAWTSNPNGGVDLQALNDTINKTFTVCSPLSGIYTVNANLPASGTNFQSFQALTSRLQTCTISGPVVVNVDSNTYNGKVDLSNIPGLSATNTLTINGNKARLLHTSDAADPTSYVLQLRDVNFVTINNFTIELSATSTKGAVISMGNANSCTIKNCILRGDLAGTATTFAGIAVSGSNTASTTATTARDNVFEDNEIIGGYYGIAITGTTATNNCSRNIIRRNKVRDFYLYGIWNSAADSTQILSNEVYRTNRATVTTTYGLYNATNSRSVVMSKNIIRDFFTHIPTSTSTAAGIFFSSSDAAAGLEAMISNNVIYNIGNNGTNYGIQNTGSDGVNIYHNTIQIEHPTATAGLAYGIFQTTAATRVDIKNNNIYVNKGGSGNKASVYFATTTSTITCNYNNLFTSQTATGAGAKNTGYWGTTGFLTLADWQLANTSAFDQNSVTADPLFTSTTVLKPNSAFINNIGTSLAAVADDITGATRGGSPDPGAYEFTPATEDAGVSAIVAPVEICPGTTAVIVRVRNYGLNVLNSVNVNWTVNGVAQTPYLYIGAIASGQDSLLTIGSFSTATNTVYNLKIWTSNPNSTVDANASNDTLLRNNLRTGLSGTYTLGGAGADFTSFTSLSTLLNANGLCGPTVINVNPGAGPYNEQFSLNQLKGASAVNTLIIRGRGATIQSLNNPTGTRHVIQLNGTDYTTIDSLNIVGYQGPVTTIFAWGIHLTNGADFNVISNNKIYVSDSSTTTNVAGIVASGSNTSATTSGNSRGNRIQDNEIYGGYYGVVLYGTTGNGAGNRGNLVINNKIKNHYLAGVYTFQQDSLIVRKNDISAPNRPSVTTYYGVYMSGVVNKPEVSANKIHDIYNAAPINTSTLYGVFITASDNLVGAEGLIFNNDIYNIQGNGTHYGLYNSNSDNFSYYYNTVALNNNNSTAGTTYGFYQVTQAANIVVLNNNFDITRAGSGIKYGIYFATNTTTAISNYNNYYMAASNGVVGFWNAVSYNTLANWQTANNGVFDLNSIAQNPLVNGRKNNIPQSGSPLLLAGTPVAGISTDLAGNTRSGATPTIGSYEVSGDFSGPAGSFVPVLNTASTSNYVLSNFATINDPAGVDTSLANRPRLYFKKSTESNTIGANNSSSNGWKVVVASNASSPFTFTIDYALLNSPVAVGDVIQYFMVGRDGLGNVSSIGAELNDDPTNVNLQAKNFPATGFSSYRIGVGIQGTILVGVNETYKNLTGNGGVFEFINSNVLAGDLQIVVKSNLSETGVHALNAFAETGGTNYKIRITPSADTIRFIAGSFAGGLLRINGADRVTIDGRFNGQGSFFQIENTTTSAGNAAVQVISLGQNAGATDFTIRNCKVKAGTGANGVGIQVGGATIPYSTGLSNHRIKIIDNTIERGAAGIYSGSEIGFENDSLLVERNLIGSDITANQVRVFGVALEAQKNAILKGNIIKNIVSTSTERAWGIASYDGFLNGSILENKIERVSSGGGAFGGRGIEILSGKQNENILIANNFIGNITGTGSTDVGSTGIVGLAILNTGGVNVYNNSINLAGSVSRTSVGQVDTSAALMVGSGSRNLNIVNNSFVNSIVNISDTAVAYAWFSAVGDTSYLAFDHNNYYVGQGNSQGHLARYAGADLGTISQIIAAVSGKNTNSISGNPNYVSATNLHAQGATLFQKGIPVVGITTDIDGDARVNPPCMGADEYLPAPNEISLLSIIRPTPFQCGANSDSVLVVINNLGTNSQTNFNVKVEITGAVTATLNKIYTKSLGVSSRDTFAIGTFNSNVNGNILVTAISELTTDQFRGNDTVRVTAELATSPAAPTASNAVVCKDGQATLVASNGSLAYRWYDSQLNLLTVNDTLITTPISSNQKFYVNTSSGLPTGAIKITEIDIGGTDMIEIQNLSAGLVNTTGWKVIVSNSYTDINNVNTIAWTLPASMNGGQVLYRTDATADNYWGNNLFWNPGAFPSFTGWAMILDQNNAVVDAVFMNWPSANIASANIIYSGNPVVIGSQWTGNGIDITTVAATSSVSRSGNTDNNNRNDFSIVATTKGVVNSSLNLPFITSGCNSDLVEVSVTVIPRPIGSEILQGAVFNGKYKAGTLADPDLGCAFDTLSYELTPPTGFLAADLGVTWIVENPIIKRLGGSAAGGTTTGTGLNLRYIVGATDRDSTLVFTAKVKNLATGCDSNITRFLKIGLEPIVNLGPDQAICSGQSIELDAGLATSYLWSTGDTTRKIMVATAGTYTVTISNISGCKSSSSINITVIPSPVVDLGTDKSACQGSTVTLDAGNAGASYLWNTGATTQTLAVTAAGTYIVTVSAGTCIDRDTVVVAFNALPIVNLGFDRDICTSDTITLDAGNAGASYLWSTGATTRTIQVSNSGTYSVTVTSTAGCTNTDAVVVTNKPAPNASFTFSIDTLNLRQIDFQAVVVAGNQYSWNFDDPASGANTSSLPNPTHLFTPGRNTFFVTLTVTNVATGCKATDTIPVIFSGIGRQDGKVFQLSAAPNPFNQETKLAFELPQTAKEVTLEIFDLVGRKVGTILQDEELAPGLHNYSWNSAGNNVANGMYLVRLTVDGVSNTIRIIDSSTR